MGSSVLGMARALGLAIPIHWSRLEHAQGGPENPLFRLDLD